MPTLFKTAEQAILPIKTIKSGFINSIWRFKKGTIIAISSELGSRLCGGLHGIAVVI